MTSESFLFLFLFFFPPRLRTQTKTQRQRQRVSLQLRKTPQRQATLWRVFTVDRAPRVSTCTRSQHCKAAPRELGCQFIYLWRHYVRSNTVLCCACGFRWCDQWVQWFRSERQSETGGWRLLSGTVLWQSSRSHRLCSQPVWHRFPQTQGEAQHLVYDAAVCGAVTTR